LPTHHTLIRATHSSLERVVMEQINRKSRLIAVKGSRGVGKTSFLLDYCKKYHAGESTCLYVNINNLFIAYDGLYHFVEYFYKLGGKVLLLDQVHKYPGWDRELRKCYDNFPDLQIVFTSSSIVRINSNPYLQGVVDMYNLSGLSFREFLELETNEVFPVYSFQEIVEHHEEIVEHILNKIRPLAHFSNYLEYGYYPIYLEQKSHIDYLLKNINLTLEFDIPYVSQIELKYLVKLKQLLYVAAIDPNCSVNISKLSAAIGVSRATVLNYLNYMRNARLLTLLYDTENDDDSGKKPKKLYIHNPNLLNAVCLDGVDTGVLRKSFFLSQLCPVCRINYTDHADFFVDGKFRVSVCQEGKGQKFDPSLIVMEDMIERGRGNVIPLWLAGFTY
ncbi:MAG: AAA family ATPase, partial [Odoribacter sp.]|nr:AAA family ATPase [Odoribacter sp.]